MAYTSISDIRANVTTTWNHPNCKFQRGDRVVVNKEAAPYKTTCKGTDGDCVVYKMGSNYNSQPIMERTGAEGHVIAASCTPDGLMRGKAPGGFYERMYTRYYVQFADRTILGIHSHFLDAVEDREVALKV